MYDNASITGNIARSTQSDRGSADAGGIYLSNGAILTMRGNSSISGNAAQVTGGGTYRSTYGGGVANWDGSVFIEGGKLSGNTATINSSGSTDTITGQQMYSSATAQLGTFDADGNWTSKGDLLPKNVYTIDNDLTIVDGIVVP
jgi:hypothetical protein